MISSVPFPFGERSCNYQGVSVSVLQDFASDEYVATFKLGRSAARVVLDRYDLTGSLKGALRDFMLPPSTSELAGC